MLKGPLQHLLGCKRTGALVLSVCQCDLTGALTIPFNRGDEARSVCRDSYTAKGLCTAPGQSPTHVASIQPLLLHGAGTVVQPYSTGAVCMFHSYKRREVFKDSRCQLGAYV